MIGHCYVILGCKHIPWHIYTANYFEGYFM